MASSPADFDELEFDEYNPHPFQGGYDIALTYGRALSPSSDICYPISSSPPSPASETPPSQGEERLDPARPGENEDGCEDWAYIPRYGQQDESERLSPRDAGESGHTNDSVEEDYLPREHDIEEFREPEVNYRPGEAVPYRELSGYWPFPGQESEGRYEGRVTGDKDPLSCAVDYLFAYLPAYGEKRDESHHYGNLNYAYERHHGQEPLSIQFSPHESSWCKKPSYHEEQEEEVYPQSGYGFSYGRDSSEVPYSEIVRVGSWSSTAYHEDDSGQVYPQSECSYAYERNYYEQPLAVQHELTEHTWFQNNSFAEFYDSHAYPQEAYMHTYGNTRYEHPSDKVDFIEKSWHQLVNNSESGAVNSYSQFKTHDDSWSNSDEQPYFPFHKYSGHDD